jgi:DnaK suppressor protein
MSHARRLLQRLAIARCAFETSFKPPAMLKYSIVCAAVVATTLGAVRCPAQQLTNRDLSVTVNPRDGSYQFGPVGSPAVLQAGISALVDHQWRRSSDYASHSVSQSTFRDTLGSGKQLTVTCSGASGSPDLTYVLQLYTESPYGSIQVRVRNGTSKAISVEAIRSIEARGDSIVNLGGPPSQERVLSDSFSEDWPDLVIYDLGHAPLVEGKDAVTQISFVPRGLRSMRNPPTAPSMHSRLRSTRLRTPAKTCQRAGKKVQRSPSILQRMPARASRISSRGFRNAVTAERPCSHVYWVQSFQEFKIFRDCPEVQEVKTSQIPRFERYLRFHFAEVLAQVRSSHGVSSDIDPTWSAKERPSASILRDSLLQAREDISSALARIREGTYGICVGCGNEIGLRELEVVPWAKFCAECRDGSGHSRSVVQPGISSGF